jgi:hypothetical protein
MASCSPSRREVALADLDNLARMDEQALDLDRLIGAPHPALEATG